MLIAAKCPRQHVRAATRPVDAQIRDFVAGKTNGAELLHALYDHVLQEPIPQRLRAVLKG